MIRNFGILRKENYVVQFKFKKKGHLKQWFCLYFDFKDSLVKKNAIELSN
jgi:hypothetical protein